MIYILERWQPWSHLGVAIGTQAAPCAEAGKAGFEIKDTLCTDNYYSSIEKHLQLHTLSARKISRTAP